MTGMTVLKPSTFRERPHIFVPLVIWCVLSPIAALMGPFDTYKLLPALPRLAYWATVVGGSVLVDAGYRWLCRGRPMAQRLVGRLGFAIVLGAMVHGLNMVVFDDWIGWQAWLWLVGVVWVIAIAIEGLVALSRAVHLLDPASATSRDEPAPDAAFQRRLPLEKRGSLIRLEAQDHYLKVVTQMGEALILLRLGDALSELSDYDGLQVHRSHWIARDQVQRVERRDGKVGLFMSDGSTIPVSRTYKPAVLALGLTA